MMPPLLSRCYADAMITGTLCRFAYAAEMMPPSWRQLAASRHAAHDATYLFITIFFPYHADRRCMLMLIASIDATPLPYARLRCFILMPRMVTICAASRHTAICR